MAKIVMGIGSSHSPTLLMEPTAWVARADNDDRHVHALHDFVGTRVTYDEMLTKVRPDIMAQIDPDVLKTRHDANQRAMAKIGRMLTEADPDLVIVIGDDHKEVFQDDNMPALSVYWGDTIPYRAQGMMKWKYDPNLQQSLWYPQEPCEFPVASGFALRLIGDLMPNFDVAHSRFYKPDQGMSHSFGYVYHKIMAEKVFPIIPVSINTYYPPNQIHPARAFALGQAIRAAVQSWPEDIRVVVMATGGLSHFVVDEAFDREFLAMITQGTVEGHAALPLEKLQSGNSEFRCWSALAGAVSDKRMELIDYVPCYRSPAGTGCAMAFATWS